MTPSKPNSTRCPQGRAKLAFLEMLGEKTDNCIVWPYPKPPSGYGTVHLGNGARKRVHCLAYSCIYGPVPKGLFVLHHCDNPSCFNPRHLFAGTIQDNHDDQKAKGRTLAGVKNPKAKLTEIEVREIRAVYRKNTRDFGLTALGKRFGVYRATIHQIVNGKTWRHLL